MACPLSNCRSTNTADTLCGGHTRQLATMLGDIRTFHYDAHDHLAPGKDGDGTGGRSREVSIGVNVNALSFIAADDIWHILGGWERVVRGERNLTPVGLLPPPKGVNNEVYRLTSFHTAHLEWSAAQPWADAFFGEVRDLHTLGMIAAKAYVQRHTRIHCPADNADGLPCRAYLTLTPDDPLDPFTCRVCGTEWTTLRLVAVAQSDRSKPLWVDVETAAHLLGKSVSQIRRVARKVHGERRRGQLVNLHAISDFYAA